MFKNSKEFTVMPICLTGICRIIIKAKNSTSVPKLISPERTLLPPTKITTVIAL